MHRRNKGLIPLLAIAFLCICCSMYVPTKTGKIKSIVESYFKGNGQEMFFIKPIVLASDDKHLTTDFTLIIPDSSNLVRSNISVFSKDAVKAIDSIKFGENAKALRDLSFMFKDHSKKAKQIRYSLQFPVSVFKSQLDQPELQITTFSSGKSETFVIAKNKWSKISKRIREVVFAGE